MKKLISILGGVIVGVIIFSQAGIFGASVNNQANVIGAGEDKLVALSTFTIIADMVGEVGGDRIESVSLTKVGAEIHGYQPTPGDLVKASEADIIFENGMNLELWTAKLRANIPDVPAVIVSEGVETISINEGSYEGKPNPHAWMSPKQGMIYIENIRRALSDIDPENAEYFDANAAAYIEKLKVVDEQLSQSLAELPESNRFFVTCEGAFTYLTNDYNLKEVYLWPINSDQAGSPQQIARVIDIVKAENIPAVFCESTVEPRIQREVVEATGTRLGGVLYVDSLSAADGPAPTYLKLLEKTAETIISGLTGE